MRERTPWLASTDTSLGWDDDVVELREQDGDGADVASVVRSELGSGPERAGPPS